jgi:hypothetical protein
MGGHRLAADNLLLPIASPPAPASPPGMPVESKKTPCAMHVHYWAVGQRTPAPLPLTLDSISGDLVEDWVPSIVPRVDVHRGPASLIRSKDIDGTEHWSLDPVLARTERQWKSVISWMLGVATFPW